jgi:hypothetical protein
MTSFGFKHVQVCLSLLGTYAGPGWIPGESTILQVLVSIQSLIFVANPYYNEPANELFRDMAFVQEKSNQYNTNVRRHTVRHAIAPWIQQGSSSKYPEFSHATRLYYRYKANTLQRQLELWQQHDPPLALITEHLLRKLSRRSKWDKASVSRPTTQE